MRQKNKNFNFRILPNSVKGISVVIGYVLLVTFAIVMGGIIYQWMKTYVPKDILECPDGISIFVDDVDCTKIRGDWELNLTLRNNGRFDIAGYFIRATTAPDQGLATLDLSQSLQGGTKLQNAVVFELGENSVKINDKKTSTFSLISPIYSIEIIPVRFQIGENKRRFVSCGTARIREKIYCS